MANLKVFSSTWPLEFLVENTAIYRPFDAGRPEVVLQSQATDPNAPEAYRVFTASPEML